MRDPIVGACWPGIYTYHRFKWIGHMSGATPDGRLAGTPTSENQGPAPGRDRLGPTATLRSLAKLPLHLTPSGGQTLTLHPTLFSGPEGTKHLGDLIETYFGLGGQHLQINIVNAETLRAAQREPEHVSGTRRPGHRLQRLLRHPRPPVAGPPDRRRLALTVAFPPGLRCSRDRR